LSQPTTTRTATERTKKATARIPAANKKRGRQKAKRKARFVRPESLPPLERPRVRLRTALRYAGLDEWKVGRTLSKKVQELCKARFVKSKGSQKRKKVPASAAQNKLLLEYLKEATRHLDPTTARAAQSQDGTTIELVHCVPRPQHEAAKPGENSPPSFAPA
jgi:hypothetical protein